MPTTERPNNEAEAIGWLVEQAPELRPIVDEHVAYNEELLPYVVFEGDFLRWFVDRVRAGDHEPRAFPWLEWAVGRSGRAESGQPVITGFRTGVDLAVLTVAENLMLEYERDPSGVATAVATWRTLA